MDTDCMEDTARCMQALGMRAVFLGPQVSVLELRGGTHLILMAKEEVTGGAAPFDLLVDDLHASRERYAALGLSVSAIEARPHIDHEVFTVHEPAGHVITVFSSHLTGQPV
jgi:hypothetical protein